MRLNLNEQSSTLVVVIIKDLLLCNDVISGIYEMIHTIAAIWLHLM